MQQLMAALLVLLLLLAVPLTANVYYVTADDAGQEQSCPPYQMCHNLSHYISEPGHYFISDTAFIFLDGQHSFDSTDLVQVNNVHNLTLKGQGQWPVAGPEETVMQSTVIINCNRGRGGFIFDTGYYITIEGLTITNCGYPHDGVFLFTNVGKLFFHKNSIQFMSGYGLKASDCESVKVANCSYYHSVFCLNSHSGGGVVFFYGHISHNSITLELTFSNMTKCCNTALGGGGIHLCTDIFSTNLWSVSIIFSNLFLSHNRASNGGGLSAILGGAVEVSFEIVNSVFFNCFARKGAGGALFESHFTTIITISNTEFLENNLNELEVLCDPDNLTFSRLSLLDSSIVHTKKPSDQAVYIESCNEVSVTNTRFRMANQKIAGLYVAYSSRLTISNSLFDRCYNLSSVVLIIKLHGSADVTTCSIINSTFSTNAGGRSVITIYFGLCNIVNSTISNNSMTGITAIENGITFHGRNVIQNNRYTEGAGITLILPGTITVSGELHMLNNTAEHRGGAILVIPIPKRSTLYNTITMPCWLSFYSSSTVIHFSHNTAETGGDDIYGGTLMGCFTIQNNKHKFIPHVGQPNETSWYFDTPLSLQMLNTSRFSSMSSDPIMVCFCNISPDCSDRTPCHVQTYPGLEINTTIATVGYYGGTSPV